MTDGFKEPTVKALLLHHQNTEHSAKVTAEAVHLVKKLLDIFVAEGISRAASIAREEAEEVEGRREASSPAASPRLVVDVEPVHIEATLPQLLLDFAA
jgi:hypothetical protein